MFLSVGVFIRDRGLVVSGRGTPIVIGVVTEVK